MRSSVGIGVVDCDHLVSATAIDRVRVTDSWIESLSYEQNSVFSATVFRHVVFKTFASGRDMLLCSIHRTLQRLIVTDDGNYDQSEQFRDGIGVLGSSVR